MKRPSFAHGVVVALSLSIAGAALFAAVSPLITPGSALRLLVSLLSLAYMLYLLAASRERTGRLATMVLWLLVAAVTWFAATPLPLYVIIHAAAIWLTRSLYYRSGVLPAVVDLGLSALSLAVALWALSHSGSLFLSIWCYFLVQALFVAIPSSLERRANRQRVQIDDNRGFQSAYRTAEAALERMSVSG